MDVISGDTRRILGGYSGDTLRRSRLEHAQEAALEVNITKGSDDADADASDGQKHVHDHIQPRIDSRPLILCALRPLEHWAGGRARRLGLQRQRRRRGRVPHDGLNESRQAQDLDAQGRRNRS